MYKGIKLFLFAVCLIGFINFSYAQESVYKTRKYSEKDIENYKVDHSVYNFWSLKNNYRRRDNNVDTLPCFVDERSYKGIINYGFEFSSKDRKNFNFNEDFVMHKLDVSIDHFNFNLKDSIVSIDGIITGGRNGKEWKEIKNNVTVFIGKRKDTLKTLYFNYLFNEKEVNITYKNEKVINHIPVDTFPAFYIEDYVFYETNHGNSRYFKIESKIDKNSILAFGLTHSFAEIFNIGEMVFSNASLRTKKTNTNQNNQPVVIIRNNMQVYKQSKLPVGKPKYYRDTEQAEKYILSRQYGKAKQIYDELLQNEKYVFARDIHNAVRCAIIARDYKIAIKWSEKLALKGIPKSYFNSKIFLRLKNNKNWHGFLNGFDSLNNIYQAGLNHNLIKKLDELIDIDQTDYVKNSKGEIERSKLKETTRYVDEELIKLINSEGFPTEEKIGISISKNGLSINSAPKYFVLFAHSYQMKNENNTEIIRIRKEASNRFEYDAERDKLNIFKSLGNTCLKIYKGNLYNNKTCNRNELQIKKVAFSFNNEYGFIIDAGDYTVIPIENEMEDDNYVFENYEFVMKLTDDWFFYEH